MTRYLIESVDSVGQWTSEVGHDSSGVSVALVDTHAQYFNTFTGEDWAYLTGWMNDMWKLVDKDQWHSDMSCTIEIDGCTFFISDISDSKH